MLSDIKTFYINLEHRTDRKRHIENTLRNLKVKDYERIPGVIKNLPWQGNTTAFYNAFTRALELNNEYTLICEDDFHIENVEMFEKNLEDFFKNEKDWDVLMLGGNNMGPLKEKKDSYCKITRTLACPAYLVRKHYYQIFINQLEISMKFMKENPYSGGDDHIIDSIINEIQKRDNWYLIFPHGAVQLPGYSDILKRYVDYSCYMKNLNPVTRWTQ